MQTNKHLRLQPCLPVQERKTRMYLAIALIGTALLAVSLFLPYDTDFDMDFGGDWFSVPVLATFAATLGWVGYGASSLDAVSGIAVAGIALVIAIFAGFAAAKLVKWLSKDEDTAPRLDVAVGEVGKIITSTGEKTPGQASVRVGGVPAVLTVVSDVPLPVGTEVIVAEILQGNKAWVVPADTTPMIETTD